jgi:hypothetical protein
MSFEVSVLQLGKYANQAPQTMRSSRRRVMKQKLLLLAVTLTAMIMPSVASTAPPAGEPSATLLTLIIRELSQ